MELQFLDDSSWFRGRPPAGRTCEAQKRAETQPNWAAMGDDLERSVASKEGPVDSAWGRNNGDDAFHQVAADKLRRSLSPRQVQMIAIGGTIGYVKGPRKQRKSTIARPE